MYFDEAIEFDNLYKALKRCCRGVRWKRSVCRYEFDAVENIILRKRELKSGRYKLSEYQRFKIYEPKEREITATRLKDRHVQMALCQAGLYKDLTRSLIHDNVACQVGKGGLFAFRRMTAHLRRYNLEHGNSGWVLNLDIKKYFPSTPHWAALEAVRKRITDPRALKLVEDVIKSFSPDGIGIGLGSQISQLVELCLLDDIDHYIKETLRIKHYERYMDDFRLIHQSKEYLLECWKLIEKRIEDLGLSLNRKATIHRLSQGVKFIGWKFRILETGKIIRTIDKKKSKQHRQKIKKLLKKEANGEAPPGTAYRSMESQLAHMARGDTYKQRKALIHYYYQTKGKLRKE